MGISYYTEGLEVVKDTTGWWSDMQIKVQWGLAETDPRARPGFLGWWNKSEGRSAVATMGMRLKMTRMQLHPREKVQYHTCQKVRTMVIETMSQKVCEGKLGSWS